MIKRVLLATTFLASSIVHVLPAVAFMGGGADSITAPASADSTQLLLAKARGGHDHKGTNGHRGHGGSGGNDDDNDDDDNDDNDDNDDDDNDDDNNDDNDDNDDDQG